MLDVFGLGLAIVCVLLTLGIVLVEAGEHLLK
jgi:hypothetical protein